MSDIICERAIKNALSSIRRDARLPHNVFASAWKDYLFFDSSGMFDSNFIDVKNILLGEEGSAEIAVINLGNFSGVSANERRVICLSANVTYVEYLALLKGDGSPRNWMFLMDRYVCASDKGKWCIYCEKENDIAVLAIQNIFSAPVLLRIRKLIGADSIATAEAPEVSHLFDFDRLMARWKATLKEEFRL